MSTRLVIPHPQDAFLVGTLEKRAEIGNHERSIALVGNVQQYTSSYLVVKLDSLFHPDLARTYGVSVCSRYPEIDH